MGYNPSKTVASTLLSREEMKNKKLVSLPLNRSPNTSRTPASSPGRPTRRFVQEHRASGQGSQALPLSGGQAPIGRCFLRSLF